MKEKAPGAPAAGGPPPRRKEAAPKKSGPPAAGTDPSDGAGSSSTTDMAMQKELEALFYANAEDNFIDGAACLPLFQETEVSGDVLERCGSCVT